MQRGIAKARGRNYGALFFAVFGGCWLLLSGYAFGACCRRRANSVTATVLVLRAALCPSVPKGDRMNCDRALRAGITLWPSAVWALAFASSTTCGSPGAAGANADVKAACALKGEIGSPSFKLLVSERNGVFASRRSGRRRRQHFLNLRPDPQGHKSLRPSFSMSSLSP